MTVIRIDRVITRLNIGGPSHHVMILTAGLNDARFQSRLLCGVVGPAEGDLTPEAVTRGLPVTQVPALRNEGGLIDAARALWTLYREFRRSRPQIVHLHQFKARLLGAVAARAAGVPHVVQTYHGTVLQRYYRVPLVTVILLLERLLGRWLVHHTIAVSEGVRRELLARGVARPQRVAVIPLGLELAPFLDAPRHAGVLRRELGLPPEAMVVGFVGRLVPIKAADQFLAAAVEVIGTLRIPVHAVVIGDGPERRRLEGRAQAAGLAGHVHFLGWRRDLARIYGDIDALAVSSLNEGTPVVIIEAMAARRAIVATRVGGILDVVLDGRTGLLVPPNDPSALAASLRSVLEDRELRERLAAAAQEAAYPRYDAAQLCETMRRYYLAMTGEVMNGRAHSRCAS